ncbi:MAG: NfeD family protein [Bacillota bacterium]
MEHMVPTLICLGIGILLFIVEMFTPGLGAAGALGAIALFAAVMLQIGNPIGILFMVALVLFIVAVALLVFFRLASHGRFDKTRIVLKDRIEGESTDISPQNFQAYVGSIGEAVTLLRPAGKAEFDGVTLDVVTSGEFLPKGARVQVVRAEGLRILVRAANAE